MSLDCIVIGRNTNNYGLSAEVNLNRYNLREIIQLDGKNYGLLSALSYARRSQDKIENFTMAEVANPAVIYLSNFLLKRNISVKLINHFNSELFELKSILLNEKPKTVAITTTFYVDPFPIIEIVQFIKTHNPEVPIIIGGPSIYSLYKTLDKKHLSKSLELIGGDFYIIEPQGEHTLFKLIKAISQKEDISKIPNILTWLSKKFIFTGEKIEDNSLNENSIGWEAFSSDLIGKTILMRTSRGCAFKCAYCSFPARASNKLSYANLDIIKNELQKLQKIGVENIGFTDDTFNFPNKRFEDLCKLIIKNNFKFNWFSFFRSSLSANPSTYQLMKESGCKGVFLGIESGNEKMLQNMNKTENLDNYRFAVNQFKKQDILTWASFMLGFPGETEKTVNDTVAFLNELSPTYVYLSSWNYDHRSPIHEKAKQFKLKGIGRNWVHGTMSWKEALDACDYFYRNTKNSHFMSLDTGHSLFGIPYIFGKGMLANQLFELSYLLKEFYDFNYANYFDQNYNNEKYKKLCDKFINFCKKLNLEPAKNIINLDNTNENKISWQEKSKAIKWELAKLISLHQKEKYID